MTTETRTYLEPSQRTGLTTLYCKLFGSITTPHSTDIVAAVEVGGGYYTFAGLDTELDYTVYEEATSGTQAVTDTALGVLTAGSLVAAAAAIAAVAAQVTTVDTVVDGIAVQTTAIKTKTDLIGTAYAVSRSPVAATGELNDIIIGDDYTSGNGNQISWTIDPTSGATADNSTCWFGGKHSDPSMADDNYWLVEGTVTDSATPGKLDISFNLIETDTISLEPGDYNWSAELRNDTGLKTTSVRSKKTRRVTLIAKQT